MMPLASATLKINFLCELKPADRKMLPGSGTQVGNSYRVATPYGKKYRSAGKADARAARSAIAAAHEPGHRPWLQAIALDSAIDDDLGRINAVAAHRMRIGILARGPGGL